jgi:2-iminobutanoate/2-iminopropanoate deaminase
MSDTIRGNRPIDTGVAVRIGKYSDAMEVRAGSRLLYLAGTPGVRPDGNLPDGIVEQAEQAWANVVSALDKAGMELSDLVKLTQYLTRREDAAAYTEVRNRVLGDVRPASMLVVGAELVWPEMLLEIEAVAARSDP